MGSRGELTKAVSNTLRVSSGFLRLPDRLARAGRSGKIYRIASAGDLVMEGGGREGREVEGKRRSNRFPSTTDLATGSR